MIRYSQKRFTLEIGELISKIESKGKKYGSIYPVPQGGTVLGTALSIYMNLPLTNEIKPDTLIVDDLVDSGRTRQRFPENDFACIHVKAGAAVIPEYYLYAEITDWVHYWWEGESETSSAEDIVVRQLQYIGEDVKREGLVKTPHRVIKAWDFLFSGYKEEDNIQDLVTSFASDGYDEIVLLKDIEMYSMCEHHLLPFFGKAHIAYIPDKKIIGVSKLARILDTFARRAQIQERIGEQVTSFLMKELQPKAAACIIEAQHLCMLMRGVQKQNSVMVTSSLKGAFLKKQEAREELMRLIK